jgi:putative transposase
MARLPRLIIPNVAVHVVQRGVDRQACFRCDTDHLVYLSNLAELSAESQCAIHAYCLMTNHVHLLLTPMHGKSCAVLMRELGKRYVPYYNRRYSRTGTLWEGRFKSCLVDTAAHVLACHRYIELNPVRAGMVGTPAAYPWSSYAANAGLVDNRLVSPHPEYMALAADRAARLTAYRAMVDLKDHATFDSAIREATSGGYPLVGDGLKSQLMSQGLSRRVERGKPGPRGREDADEDQIALDLSK